MAEVVKTALVPHSASEMYALVNDIDSYKEFLPWCKESRMLSHKGDTMCGEIVVAKSGISQTFSTCNTLLPDRMVKLDLKEGPFSKLHGAWEFEPLREDACKVSLRLEFEFSGRLIDKAFGAIFSSIANSMVDAFCKRAKDVYVQ